MDQNNHMPSPVYTWSEDRYVQSRPISWGLLRSPEITCSYLIYWVHSCLILQSRASCLVTRRYCHRSISIYANYTHGLSSHRRFVDLEKRQVCLKDIMRTIARSRSPNDYLAQASSACVPVTRCLRPSFWYDQKRIDPIVLNLREFILPPDQSYFM